jgi:superfamily II DNA/RNA helicase
VAGISHVINFDAPRQAEDYVHRIGRTGRAGRSGMAVTLINPSERRLVRDIERYTGQQVQVDTIAGLEPKIRDEQPARKPRVSVRHRSPGGNDFRSGAKPAEGYRGGKPKTSGSPYATAQRPDREGAPARRRSFNH